MCLVLFYNYQLIIYMENLRFICLTWNNYLPKQSIIEATCGYYAYANLIEFSKIIENNINVDIIENIRNNLKQKSYQDHLIDDIHIYRKMIGKDMISTNDAYKINEYEYHKTGKYMLDYNVYTDSKKCYYTPAFISMFDKDVVKKALLNKNNCIYKFIIQSEYYKMVNHMVPIVIQKIGNVVYIHILDSYCLLWNGDNILRLFYKEVFGMDITNNLECKNISLVESIYSLLKKSKEFIEIVIALVVILYTFF
mgnify:FL=1|jgi:hypothetical protein